MKIRLLIPSFLAALALAGCGGSLSDAYVTQRMADEGLRTLKIVPLGSWGDETRMVFVEGADEKGCFLVWGADNNMGFTRYTTEGMGWQPDPAAPALVFDAEHNGSQLACVFIQDPALDAALARIEIDFPHMTLAADVEPGQTHYFLEDGTDRFASSFKAARFYDSRGALLYEQAGH
ncbi:MAG TPA: hypothetical protein VGE07_28405 [Herpetosiphonaceae bacterium]